MTELDEEMKLDNDRLLPFALNAEAALSGI